MTQDDEDLTETAWREAFRLRLRELQEPRTAADMGKLLGISDNTYSKYVGRGSLPPIRMLPDLARIFGVPLEQLIDGVEAPSQKMPKKQRKRKIA